MEEINYQVIFRKHEEELKRMDKKGLDEAWKLMQKAEKENSIRTGQLKKKMKDEKQQLLAQENQKQNLLQKKLNMIEKNIRKTQEMAATQAHILNLRNQQQTGFKTQIKTQKMYFELFNKKNSRSRKNQSHKPTRIKNDTTIVGDYLKYQIANQKTFKSKKKLLLKLVV